MTRIYVVVGRTGEYSDKSEWPVCWRPTLAEAEAMVAVLTEQAQEYTRRDKSSYGVGMDWGRASRALDEYRATMLDPYFASDYTGTSYHVWVVPDGPAEVQRDGERRGFEVAP